MNTELFGTGPAHDRAASVTDRLRRRQRLLRHAKRLRRQARSDSDLWLAAQYESAARYV